MRNLKRQLHDMNNDTRTKPNVAWVRENRASLMSTIRADRAVQDRGKSSSNIFENIKNTISGIGVVFVPQKILIASRYALTLLLIVGVSVSGWIGAAVATEDSLPGDVLHGLKVATEGVELAVTSAIGSRERKVEVILKHASSRVKEYSQSTSPEQNKASLDSLKKKIETTGKELEKTSDQSPTDAMKIAKVVEKKTEQILGELGEVAQEKTKIRDIANPIVPVVVEGGLIDDTNTTTAGKVEISDTRSVTLAQAEVLRAVVAAEAVLEQTGVAAVTAMVTESQKPQSVITKEEVRDVIEKKFDRLTENISTLNSDTKVSTTTVTSSEKMISGSVGATTKLAPKPSTGVTVATGTVQGGDGTATTTGIVDSTVVIVTDTKQMIEMTNLSGALEQIQKLTIVKGKVAEENIVKKTEVVTGVATPQPTSEKSISAELIDPKVSPTGTPMTASGTLPMTSSTMVGSSTVIRSSTERPVTP
jgi:hypothetical protein